MPSKIVKNTPAPANRLIGTSIEPFTSAIRCCEAPRAIIGAPRQTRFEVMLSSYEYLSPSLTIGGLRLRLLERLHDLLVFSSPRTCRGLSWQCGRGYCGR